MAEEQTAAPKKEKPKDTGKADIGKRIVAAIIDGLLAGIVGLIPIIGGLIGAAYLLLRDGLEVDFMDQRSLGKKVMKLRPVLLDGGKVDLMVSVKRNWLLAIPSVLMIIPVLGWVMAPIIGLIIGLISYILGSVLSFPITGLLSNVISRSIFNSPAKFVLAAQGFAI